MSTTTEQATTAQKVVFHGLFLTIFCFPRQKFQKKVSTIHFSTYLSERQIIVVCIAHCSPPLTIHGFGHFHVIFYTLGFQLSAKKYHPQFFGGSKLGILSPFFIQNLREFRQKSATLERKSATLGKLLREFWKILREFWAKLHEFFPKLTYYTYLTYPACRSPKS